MYTKLKATGYSSLVLDYITSLKVLEENDILLLCETLSLSSNNLKNKPEMLAGQLLGRLLAIPSPSSALCQLLSGAKDWITQCKASIFQPLNNCLISPGGQLKATLSGHPQVVLGISKSPSLPLIVSYSKDNDCSLFQVWDLSSLQCIENLCTLKLPGGDYFQPPNFIATSGHLVAGNSHSLAIWSMKTGTDIKYVEYDNMELTCIASTRDCQPILVGTRSGLVLWESKFSAQKECTTTFGSPIKSMHITPNDKFTIVQSGEEQIALLDNISKQILESVILNCSHSSAMHTAENQSGHYCFIVGYEDGSMTFMDIPSLTTKTLKSHSKAIKCITSVPSLNVIVSGSLDNLLYVWDMKTNSIMKKLKGHMDGIWCVATIPNTTCLVSGSKDDYLKVWDIKSGECLHTLEGHSSWISCVAPFASDLLVSGSNDKTLKIWKLEFRMKGHNRSDRHQAQPECIELMKFNHENMLVASGAPDAIKVWDPSNGKCLHSIPSSASCLLFASRDSHLICGSKDGTMNVYDALNGFSQIKTIKQHKDRVTSLLSLDCGLISASLDSTLKVWNINYDEKCTFHGHSAGVTCFVISNSSFLVASGSRDTNVCLWDLLSSKCTAILNGHTKIINCLAFKSDDTLLVSGSDDTTARVWNIIGMTCIISVKYTDSVKCTCFLNQKMFVAGAHCSYNQLRLWNIDTGECVKDFVGHSHAVMCMVIIDDLHILTGSRDGTIRVWNARTSEMLGHFDLQSQVKYISLAKMSSYCFMVAATTKSGPIAMLQLTLPD